MPFLADLLATISVYRAASHRIDSFEGSIINGFTAQASRGHSDHIKPLKSGT